MQLKALQTLKELEFFCFSSFFVLGMMLQFLYEDRAVHKGTTQ